MNARSTIPVLLTALATAGACDNPVGSEQRLEIGVISYSASDTVVIEAPDTVQAGVPFEVAIQTYAGGCDNQGPTGTAVVEGERAEITPMDYFYKGSGACIAILNVFDHRASVVLSTPGTMQLLFYGRVLPGDSVITVTRELVVR